MRLDALLILDQIVGGRWIHGYEVCIRRRRRPYAVEGSLPPGVVIAAEKAKSCIPSLVIWIRGVSSERIATEEQRL